MNMTHFLMIFSTLCLKNKDVSIEKTFDQLIIVTSFPVICHIFQFWIRFVLFLLCSLNEKKGWEQKQVFPHNLDFIMALMK